MGIVMKLGTAIAEIMKREGIEILCGRLDQSHAIHQRCNLSSVIGRSRMRLPVA